MWYNIFEKQNTHPSVMENRSDNLITKKLFRKEFNLSKVQFIIENSDITYELIVKSALIANLNPYHNFGHMLGVCEGVIKILTAEGATREEINREGLSALRHDAGHTGRVLVYDEIYSFQLNSMIFDEDDLKITGLKKDAALAKMRDGILATIFGNRGKINDRFAKVIQDADLGHLGYGPIYWLYASMGLVDEFANEGRIHTPQQFIFEEQRKFVSFLKTCSPNNDTIYLSEGAKKVFTDPEVSLKALENFKPEAIQFAYDVRKSDITFEDFEKEINRLNLAA
jgi:hypothetical protein